MNLNNFKLLKEDADSYHVGHPNGKTMQISKSGLSDKAHKLVQKMKGKAQNFDDGGQAVPSPQPNPQPSQDQDNTPPADAPTSADSSQPLEIEEIPQGDTDSVASTQAMPIPGDGAPATPVAQAVPSNPFEAEKAANLAGAKATTQQGQMESKAIGDVQDKIDQLPTQQDIIEANRAKNDQLFQAYSQQKLDPNRYMHSLSTGSKIAAGIGMLLSGFGGGASHQAPMAQQVIQNAINSDIDAQKNDQGQALNLWKMNREALGSDLSANLATQNQMYTGLKYKLFQAASQFKGPQAMAAAQGANALIDQKMMMNNSLLGLHAGLTNQAGDGSEQGFINNMNVASRLAPDMAKQAQEKYIPGVGVARVPVTKEDRDSLTSMDNLDKQLDHAVDFAKTQGTTMYGTTANQQAGDIQNSIQLEIGNLVGLKRINEFEAKKYTDMAGNPGAFRTKAAVQSFQDLKQLIDDKRAALNTNLGITPFRKAAVDQNAIAWAKQNPSDPRAMKILQINGAK